MPSRFYKLMMNTVLVAVMGLLFDFLFGGKSATATDVVVMGFALTWALEGGNG